MGASYELLEWRRLRALAMIRLGWRKVDIAHALGVTRGAVSHWMAEVHRGGKGALRSHPSPGRPPKLSVEQHRLIPDILWHGAEAYGFRGEVWTTERVSEVLALEFGVTYSKSHISRLLKAIGWTPQMPITRALQRNEREIRLWQKNVWPEIMLRARKERRTLACLDESGFYLLPGMVKSYAPVGLTPILHEWLTRDHLAVMGAITTGGRIYTMIRQKSFAGEQVIEFLIHLLKVASERLLIVWDRSPIHRRVHVQEFLKHPSLRGSIHAEYFPAYAPELNPIEGLWQHMKHVELRNHISLDLEDLHGEVYLTLNRLRQKPRLVKSFFQGAGLPIGRRKIV